MLPFARYSLDPQTITPPDIEDISLLLDTIGCMLSSPNTYYAPTDFLRSFVNLVEQFRDNRHPTFSEILENDWKDHQVYLQNGLPDAASTIVTPCILVDKPLLVEIYMPTQEAIIHFCDPQDAGYMDIISDVSAADHPLLTSCSRYNASRWT
jgi:hypothetical protein